MPKFAASLFAALILLGATGCTPAPVAEAPSNPTNVVGPEYGFYNEEELREHYSKHGAEFGSITREEYLAQARTLRDAPSAEIFSKSSAPTPSEPASTAPPAASSPSTKT